MRVMSICLLLFTFLLIAVAASTLKIIIQKTLAEWRIYSVDKASRVPAAEALTVIRHEIVIPSTVSVNGVLVTPPQLEIPDALRLNLQRRPPSAASPQSGHDTYQHLEEPDSLRAEEVCFRDSAVY